MGKFEKKNAINRKQERFRKKKKEHFKNNKLN